MRTGTRVAVFRFSLCPIVGSCRGCNSISYRDIDADIDRNRFGGFVALAEKSAYGFCSGPGVSLCRGLGDTPGVADAFVVAAFISSGIFFNWSSTFFVTMFVI